MAIEIPQVDVRGAYIERREEIDAAVLRTLDGGWYVLGHEVAAFEAEFSSWLGADASVGVGSGTDAVALALRGLGVGVGCAVFTVSHTATATVAAIELTGANPVMVDVDPASHCMDPSSLAAAIDAVERDEHTYGRAAAIVLVHLYGHAADVAAITPIAAAHGLRVVEDCAQAHGALVDGRPVGTWGDIAAFSFYPTKNLGAMGDGGLVASSDADLVERVRLLAQYGWRERFVSEVPGTNSRLDELQAAILRVRLTHLDEDNARRRAVAAVYDALLMDTSVEGPTERAGTRHVYHQYVVRVPGRDDVRARLAAAGIGTAVHYPTPVHRQPAYANRVPRAVPLTVTERLQTEILSLPMYPQLSHDDAARVASVLVSTTRGAVVHRPTNSVER